MLKPEVDPFTFYTLFELERIFGCSEVTLWRAIRQVNVSYSRSYPYLHCRSHRIIIPSWELWKFSNCALFRKWLVRLGFDAKNIPRKFYQQVDQEDRPRGIAGHDVLITMNEFVSKARSRVIFSVDAIKILVDTGLIPCDNGLWIPAYFAEAVLRS